LAGIRYRGEAFPKIGLLPFSFLLLIQLAYLLLWTRPSACAAGEENDDGRREKQEPHNIFHTEFIIVSLTDQAIISGLF